MWDAYTEHLDPTSKEVLEKFDLKPYISEVVSSPDPLITAEEAISVKDLESIGGGNDNCHQLSELGTLTVSPSAANSCKSPGGLSVVYPSASTSTSMSTSMSTFATATLHASLSKTSRPVAEEWLYSKTAMAASEADKADNEELHTSHTSQCDDSFAKLFPTPPTIDPQLSPTDRRLAKYCTFMQQWKTIISEWKKDNKTLQAGDYKAVKHLGREGIPDCFRADVWTWLLNAQHLYEQNEVYTDTSVFTQYLQREIDVEAVVQIGKDVDRTLPRHPYFKTLDGQHALFLVLKAFASHDDDISYCQGMNCPAAMILIYITNLPLAFWCFYRFIKKFGDMYLPSLYGVRLRALTLKYLLDELEPQISKYLDTVGIDLLQFAPSWFMTIFSSCLKFSISVRIFDSFLCEGEKAVFRAAIAVLKTAADGKMIPRPPAKLRNELEQKYNVKWPYPLNSQAYFYYFNKWMQAVKQPGDISILCMPLEYAQLYLNRLPKYISYGERFMEQCLAVKFKTALLNECRERATDALKRV